MFEDKIPSSVYEQAEVNGNDYKDIYKLIKALEAATQVNTNMVTALSSQFDSIDVSKMSKGAVTTAHSGISSTATSNEIDCRGFSSVLVHVDITGTGTWKIDVQGSMTSGGTFADCYDNLTQLSTGNITTDRCILFRGITDYIKIVATEVADGATCTVNVQPLN